MSGAPLMVASARRRAPAYPVPTARPWNALAPLVIPTYDGTGETVHLDVIDFAQEPVAGGKFNGWRFWMSHSPYSVMYGDQNEDPSLLVSQDGISWQTPPGLTNPVYLPTGPGYQSDPDIAYDPETGDLVLIWRNQDFQWMIARSADGITWPETPAAISWASAPGAGVSASILREADGDWLMWATGTTGNVYYYTAAAPEGPWTMVNAASVPNIWHANVIHAPTAGQYLLLSYAKDALQHLTAVTLHGPALQSALPETYLLKAGEGPSSFDAVELYRPALALHEDGESVRVWYSGNSASVWRVGHTIIPLSEWPTPA